MRYISKEVCRILIFGTQTQSLSEKLTSKLTAKEKALFIQVSFLPSRRYFSKTLLCIFTNCRKCDIIKMPNNLNIHSYRFFLIMGTIAFLAIQLSKLVLVKALLLLDCIENLCYEEIVWRQLELAFFGALTSVGAFFIFCNRRLVKWDDIIAHRGRPWD